MTSFAFGRFNLYIFLREKLVEAESFSESYFANLCFAPVFSSENTDVEAGQELMKMSDCPVFFYTLEGNKKARRTPCSAICRFYGLEVF